jgi:plastocyanin
MRPVRSRVRAARTVIALLALVLAGCAADDPLVIEVTQQTSTTAGVTDDGAADFPPLAPDISRPDELFDFRGQEVVEIEIRDNVFDARFFRVDPGTRIVFTNRGANTHDVTASAEGAFPKITKEALEDAPQALVLDVAGDYPFFCSIHGTANFGQTGYVVVGDG